MMRSKLLFFLLLVLPTAAHVSAQDPAPIDSAGLHSFADGVIQTYLEQEQIAGATVAIVRNGKPLLLKGYGYDRLDPRREVDADSTLFRIGSISKLFVWTAVMQQVEAGRLDLNADINRYLGDLKISDDYPEPITLKNLLTHTAGFEDRVVGLFSLDSAGVRPLGQILTEQMPARVRAPGLYASYSNHGAGLAALIVEEVTGQPFQEYVRRNILDPLQIEHVTFRQPVPERGGVRVSRGFARVNGLPAERPFEYVPMAAIGGGSASAAGMIPFMQAHLNLGTYEGAAILDSATARLMQSQAFSHHEAVNPMRYGFIDMSRNGVTIFGHGGALSRFHSMMALFPEHDLGIFLSFNTETGSGLGTDFLHTFTDRYFPPTDPLPAMAELDEEYLSRFAGFYRPNRYSHENLTKIGYLFTGVEFTPAGDGALRMSMAGEASRWVPVDSLLFRREGTTEKLVFEEGSDGTVARTYMDAFPDMAFEKTTLVEGGAFHGFLLSLAIAVYLATMLYWPTAWIARRQYRPTLITNPPLPVREKAVAYANALLMLIFYAGMAAMISDPGNIIYGVSSSVRSLLFLPLLSAACTAGMIYLTSAIWSRSLSGIWSRIAYTLITLVSVVALWQLFYWNLLGFQY